MAVTLLAMFRRPDGGDEGLETFLRRYHAEHLPLIAQVPGLRSTSVQRVTFSYTPDVDLVLTNHMVFDDRETLDAAMGSDPMRQAGRLLREIAPGLLILVVLEDEPGEDRPGDPAAT